MRPTVFSRIEVTRLHVLRAVCMAGVMGYLAVERVQADVFVQQRRDDVPIVKQIVPPALVIGAEMTVTLVGERLEGLNQILCDSSVQLKQVIESNDKTAKLVLRVDEAAKPGPRPIYFLCKPGLSNPRLLLLDRSVKCSEREGNNSIATANSIELPCGVCGTLIAADRDVYAFEAAAGETLTFDLHASRLGSPISGGVAVLVDQGKQVARAAASGTNREDDPYLIYRFAKQGRYFIAVSDLTYQGADYCAYYLRAGTFPVATKIFPLGGRRNAFATDGSPVEPKLGLAVGDLPEQNEDALTQSGIEMRGVKWPCTINGRVEQPDETDQFRIQLAANQQVRIRVLAQRLGSPLDSVLAIKDESGKELAAADDISTKDWQPLIVRDNDSPQICDDAELEFSAPRAGLYTVELTDRFRRGGTQYAYRLEVDEPRPDFALMVQPGKAVVADQKKQQNRGQQVVRDFYGQGTGSLSIDRGGQGNLVVKLLRRDYDGPIELKLDALPTGLRTRPTTIPAGQNQAELVLYADFDAPSSASLVVVTGVARVDGKEIVRRAAHPVVFASTPLGGAVGDDLAVVAVGISQQGAKLAARGAIQGALVPGSKTRLVLDIRRREGIVGEVKVRPLSVPTGLQVPSITLSEKESRAEIELAADVGLLPGSRTLRFEAQLQPKASGKKKPEPLLAIAEVPLKIQPLVALKNAMQTIDLARGKQAGVTVEVERSKAFVAPIELTADRLPTGVTIQTTTIAGGADSFEIVFQAAVDAAASPIRRVVQVKPTTRVGDTLVELPPLRFALKVTKQ